MASMGKSISKKKVISRDQLMHMLSCGRNLWSNQALRCSPRSHQVCTLSLCNGASIQHSLFSEETYSMANKVTQPKFAGGGNKDGSNSCTMVGNATNITSSTVSRRNSSKEPTERANLHIDNEVKNSETRVHQSVSSGGTNSNMVNLGQTNVHEEHLEATPGDYNSNRRRMQVSKPKNDKGRGPNKLKVSKNPVLVDVNENLRPISASSRQMSSLIGVLARVPRKLPLDCFDWRKMEQQKKDSLWQEVKRSFCFLERKEPYDWAMEKMHACWRGYKSELKVEHFDGKSHDEATQSRPSHIPPDTWDNLVAFWESNKGKQRSKRGIENRQHNKMRHHAGTKSFAHVCVEEEEKGNMTDKL